MSAPALIAPPPYFRGRKLTGDDVVAMRANPPTGRAELLALARRYQTVPKTIRRALRGDSWTTLPAPRPRGTCRSCARQRCPLRARGLCYRCHSRMTPAQRAAAFPLPRRDGTTRLLVEDACTLRARYGAPPPQLPGQPHRVGGKSWDDIAAELNVTPLALQKARQRCGWPDPTRGRPVRDPREVNAERVAAGRRPI